MKVYFNNSCKICKAEIDLYKKEKIQEIDWIDITNNGLAEKETSRNSKELLRRLHVKENEKVLAIGDNLRTDIKGANNLNFDCIYISEGVHRDEYKDDSELENLLKKYNVKANFFEKKLKW